MAGKSGREQTVGVKPMGDGIEVRFKLHGKTMRPRLQLKPTKANLLHASRLREQIVKEIASGNFDMLAHFPDYKFADKVRVETATASRTVKEWFEVWGKLSERDLEYSSLINYQRHFKTYWLPVFGDRHPAQVTHEDVLKRLSELTKERFDEANGKTYKPLSRKTQNNILIPLRGVFDLICRSEDVRHPCEGVENLKVQTAAPDPFSVEEVEIALKELRQQGKDALADYFEFAAFAGLRTSEQIALLWEDVDLRTGCVLVRRAKVMTKAKERTKTSVERLVELCDRAVAVLQRQRARTQTIGAEVFYNPATNRPWNDDQEQRRDWKLLLRKCGIRHRPPKELRDSSVTFALGSGADPWWVAQMHGHSLQVMMKSYARWIPSADKGRNRAKLNVGSNVEIQKAV